MNILIAMDSLKGSLSSLEANESVKTGLLQADPKFRIQTVPIADGGQGTVEALVYATNGHFVETVVTGPLGNRIAAKYGILGEEDSAVIEVAEACGLPLLQKEQLNPQITTTYGVGELILDALNKGCRHFIIGLGGSATNDAGIGMLQALGYQFLNREGQEVGFGGGQLEEIAKIDSKHVSDKVKKATFRVACDVNNPLYGTNGAAYIYGPQKGATPEMIQELDNGLRHFANVVFEQMGLDLQNIAGAGAAGGLGAAFAGFLNSRLQSGVQLILDINKLERKLMNVDLVITGEGKLDGQTSMGKAPAGIANLAKKRGIPVIALAGDITDGQRSLYDSGITAYFAIVGGPVSLEVALDRDVTRENLMRTAEQIGRVWATASLNRSRDYETKKK
ncbi:glycerate kinase [Robertmurraya sp. DFI.2.37]|uniref:glycerate kinase family protein n=1 Tax=Robertmurraya sp. DFI.2.37 TaxID=3031819 RepID=UPI001244D541|nr:glycerate kinase [Robertmurraya sp. DFI.2.37]MDF1511257.1 glycerate kinase [Robertmurraya sp. DFI.2.37]